MKFCSLRVSSAFRSICTAFGVLAFASGLTAQITLAGWEFAGHDAINDNPLAATTLGENISAASLQLGPGLSAVGTADTFTANSFDFNSLADAIDNDDYFSFTVTPVDGASFTPSSLSGRFRLGSFAHMALFSSATGFTVGAEIWSGDVPSGFRIVTIDLSTAYEAGALTEATEFRFYAYRDYPDETAIGLTPQSGVDDFVLSGTTAMAAVPEPSTYAAIAGGCALAGAAWRRRAGRKSAQV